ncbi:PDR/VanB family oxidoreductase [Enemella evansiae]|uniref:Oxidoreductase n=1 Tax=Enemella evansiae TaxID=2016499 RepID=A0A255GLJ3_9ACTN|nr:PDR/VanB family oxidoreductase [Enemella evansiae]PFG65695.1 vanillate demethylase subunit B [Propionibacteriaceae bacterium ES.041]OYN98607.1 oxidoreductase [Enemella evansiae]OYO01951.1 oxidoreductase [Enemella evansiae]OYO02200.1 oxidoreductase [Enemella evansiae]OYO10880.1 oxidoreductase [Enemella evansiae]
MAATVHRVWQTAEVVATRQVAERVRRVELSLPMPTRVPAGSHLDLMVPLPGGEDLRSYSIVDADADGSRVALSVQLAPASRGGSAYLHSLQVGDRIRVTQPVQNFPLGVGAPRYLLLAGGIGITALCAMAEVLRQRGVDYELVYVGRSRPVMAYAAELAERHPDRIRMHVDDEGTGLSVDTLLDELAADPLAQRTEVYLCGPIRLMDAIRRGWATRGLPVTNLRFETFGNSGSWEPQEFEVSIPRLGVTTTVGRDATMLEALESAGVEMMWDCRKGECGLCQVRVLEVEGAIDHRDVFFSPDEQESGGGLCACVSRIAAENGDRARVRIDVT